MTIRPVCLVLLALLPACSSAPTSEGAPERSPGSFGDAVRHNMQAQIILRDGETTTLAPAPGLRRSLATARYQTDQVEKPFQIFTRGD